MITELMIILIVVGAIIIFVAWTSTRKRKNNDDDRRDAEDSTEKFKSDLEKTANEIIGRMEKQAANLEKLLNNSERSRAQIEGRIAEMKKLLRQCEIQTADMKNLLSRLDDTLDEMDQRKINTKPARPVLPTVNPKTPPVLQPQGFAQVLEQSISEQSTPTKKISDLPATFPAFTREETEISADSVAVREMLASGMTVEEVAKETGLGRGAVLLVQQMMRRQNKRL